MAAALAGVNTAGRATAEQEQSGNQPATLKGLRRVAHHPEPEGHSDEAGGDQAPGRPTVSASRPVVIESSGLPSPVRATTSPDTAAVAPIPSSR